ncbi:hypothetical protein GO730_03410 [Spirosoma sp. HMF3257]|uniref:Uncharacterized protein n=1 Tax=Spirosoma telluris TaxID=2183553 RepID=A0A327NHB2_9BACT|nr:hypothetical protein [Spirosoma telluris]RAI73689.1 hypothetical protein HMF3257_03340 [Spirosoma telluris]
MGHENRAVCWIDDNTIAVTYNPFTEGDDNSDKDSANEIHIYTLSNHKIELTNKIKITKIDIITTEISYNKYLNSFIIFSDNLGVAVISLTGEILYHNSEFKVNNYFAQTNLFLTTKSKSVEINQIII